MLTFEGAALIAELIAAALVATAVIGFCITRSKLWLVGSIMALVALIAAVTIVVATSA